MTVIAMALVAVSSISAAGTRANSVTTELSIALRKHPDDTLDTSLPYWQFLQNKLQLKFNFIPLPEEGWPEKRNVLLASGETYDMISTEPGIANMYGAEGLFDEIGPLLQQYKADNVLQDLLDPAVAYNFRDDQNRLFMIPRWYEYNAREDRGIIYRKDILDALGMQEPETMDGWYQVFKAVKATYPDMIPLTCNVFQAFADVLLPYWDVMRISGNYGFIGSQQASGRIVYTPATDNYRQALGYWAKLYSEGLLDREYPTITYDQWMEKIANGRIFAHLSSGYRADWSSEVSREAGTNIQYVMAKPPLSSAGKRELYGNFSPWIDIGVSIYSTSKHKAEAMKLFNYLYSTEGAREYAYGVEGLTYTVQNGNWVKKFSAVQFTPERFNIGYGSHLPRIDRIVDGTEYDDTTPNQLFVEEVYKPFSVMIPIIKVSDTAGDELRSINTSLDTFMNTLFNEVVIGRRSLNDWNAIVAEMERLGSRRGTELIQQAYDDWLANTRR